MKTKENKGITLIALVITIIVLLILAGVTIATLTGENGILTKATDAKEQNAISGEKEQLDLAVSAAKIDGLGENIEKSNLEKELNKLFEKSDYDLTGEGPFIVKFTDSGKSYTINEDGSIEEKKEVITNYTQEEIDADENLFAIGDSGVEGVLDNSVVARLEGDTLIITKNGENSEGRMGNFSNASFTGEVSNPYLIMPWLDTSTGEQIVNFRNIKIEEGVINISNWGFGNCNTVENVELASTVKNIGNMAFANLTALDSSEFKDYNLTNINLNYVDTVGECAFAGCNNLVDIDISNVKIINAGAFTRCTGLKEINLVKTERIGWSAFNSCTSLKKIYLPSSLVTIESPYWDQAIFCRCSSELQIYCGASSKPEGWDNMWNSYGDSDYSTKLYNDGENIHWGISYEEYLNK